MDHLNCFILESIAKSLQTRIAGSKLVDCFSNSVDELCIELEQMSIRCVFYEGSIFFHFDAVGPGKNRLYKPQFTEIKGLAINDVQVHAFERSFHIDFEGDFKLVFKCHGRKSNVILFHGNEQLDMFRLQLEKDADLGMQDIYRTVIPVFDTANFASQETFTHAYPYLPVEFYGQLDSPTKESFNALIQKYRNLKGLEWDETYALSPLFKEDTILEDTSQYSAAWLRHITFKTQKERLLLKYEQSIREKQNFIAGNKKALAEIEARRSDEEIGHIILSNLHLIKAGDKIASVYDIYHNQTIDIKLDEKLSPVENAEKYYKKEKGRPFMIEQLQNKISKAEQDLEIKREQLRQVQEGMQYKSIKHLLAGQQKSQDEVDLPYKKFEFENYEILVGKHAESNEKILNYFSSKDDTWLHAKDVSGSHVLIKTKRNEKLPERVLEKAASLAAYYSKNRNQALVTVTYTLRKYVRKIKGADKGKVTVSQEKSILVKPGGINNV